MIEIKLQTDVDTGEWQVEVSHGEAWFRQFVNGPTAAVAVAARFVAQIEAGLSIERIAGDE